MQMNLGTLNFKTYLPSTIFCWNGLLSQIETTEHTVYIFVF